VFANSLPCIWDSSITGLWWALEQSSRPSCFLNHQYLWPCQIHVKFCHFCHYGNLGFLPLVDFHWMDSVSQSIFMDFILGKWKRTSDAWATVILVASPFLTLKAGMCKHDNLKDIEFNYHHDWESQLDAVPRLVAWHNMTSSFIEYMIRSNEMTEWHDISYSHRNLILAGDQYTN